MTTGMTLDEALRYGQGTERPFRCSEHDDNSASASVNVTKGVWFCFSCGGRGRVSGKKAPTVDELIGMLYPDRAARVYPDFWLELFQNNMGDFAERFPAWIRYVAGLGCDPLNGDSVFPVHTRLRQLAGVGRRRADPGDGPRYVYPPRWSAATSVFIPQPHVQPELFLVEGAADSTAVAETGAYVFGMYGAGVHAPQVELIARANPKLIVCAFDDDDAGRRATFGWDNEKGEHRAGAMDLLSSLAPTTWCKWGDKALTNGKAKDPAELDLETRREVMAKTVGGAQYGSRTDAAERWTVNAVRLQADYARHVEENADE